jgi:hypothetical protein
MVSNNLTNPLISNMLDLGNGISPEGIPYCIAKLVDLEEPVVG